MEVKMSKKTMQRIIKKEAELIEIKIKIVQRKAQWHEKQAYKNDNGINSRLFNLMPIMQAKTRHVLQ